MKICNSCGTERESGDCRPCKKAYNRAYYLRNKDRFTEYGAKYRKDNREKILARKRDHYRENADRIREANRCWHKANHDRILALNRAYKARARASSTVPFSLDKLQQRLSMFGGRCWICRQSIQDGDMHVDHVKPLSKGGVHMLSNLRPAHAMCNMQKGSQWPYHPSQSPEMEAPRWRLKSPK